MFASLLLAGVLIGQCPGGTCAASPAFYVPRVVAVAKVPVGAPAVAHAWVAAPVVPVAAHDQVVVGWVYFARPSPVWRAARWTVHGPAIRRGEVFVFRRW